MIRVRNREEAISLLREHGIEGSDIYFVELLLLLEMVWADGLAQPAERDVLGAYTRSLVERLNALAGYRFVNEADGRRFTARFLTQRPSAELLETLRQLAGPALPQGPAARELRESLLAACLNIGAAAVVELGDRLDERFNAKERAVLFQIIKALQGSEEPRELGRSARRAG